MAQKKVKSEEIVEETDELKESPIDALIEQGFDIRTFIGDYIGFAIIGYLLILLFYLLLWLMLLMFD